MKIVPQTGPAFVNHNAQVNAPIIGAPGNQSNLAKENRSRAIEAFNRASMGTPPQTHQNTVQEGTSVQNASNVSPEEMSGLRAPSSPSVQESEQSDTVETQEAASPPPAKVEEPLSPHYAVLARKEKALRAETQKLNVARAAFKAEQEALKGTGAPASQPAFDESKYIPKDRLTQDTVGVLEELGLSREDIANRLLNPDQISPAQASYMAKLEAKIAKLESAQDESKKTFESSQTDAYNQAITAMKYEAQDLVNNDPEFATIKETGQSEEIVNLIKDVHEKGLPGKYRKGTLLSVEQAARLVEDELVNQWVEQHDKLSKLEKIQKRLKPATPVAKQSQPSQGTPTEQSSANQTKTLTNSMGSSKRLSARDRAIAVFNGNK